MPGGGRFPQRVSKSIQLFPSSICGIRHRVTSAKNGNIRSFASQLAAVSVDSQSRMETHDAAVHQIATKIRDFTKANQKFRINHGSTNSTRPRQHPNSVDVGHLSSVLSINVEKQTCIVEPNVSMDRLVEATLPHGLIPPVVMEFPGITVGGGYSGTSGESSSFKHGFFDRTINWVEMVLADGSVVRCSPEGERSDLFEGAAGAMGTLGVTTLVELKLTPARKYIEATYHPVHSVGEALRVLEQVTNDEDVEFVDGILFSKQSGAIITGKTTDTPRLDAPIRTFSNAWDPWFYLHVQSLVQQQRLKASSTTTANAPITETIPLAEYLFRYDRGGFWVGASAFKHFRTPFNRLTRWFLDDFLHTRMMYTALHVSGQSRQYVVQDLAIPYENVATFIDYTDKVFGIWPLWLCPLKTPPSPTMHPTIKGSLTDSRMLNVGLWGFGPRDFDTFVLLNKDLEHKLQELGGVKWLYAHTYYSEDEFWTVYDQPWYRALREKYGATMLPDVYEKVRIDVDKERSLSESWKNRIVHTTYLGGLYGIWKAIQTKSYVAARAASWRTRDVNP